MMGQELARPRKPDGSRGGDDQSHSRLCRHELALIFAPPSFERTKGAAHENVNG